MKKSKKYSKKYSKKSKKYSKKSKKYSKRSKKYSKRSKKYSKRSKRRTSKIKTGGVFTTRPLNIVLIDESKKLIEITEKMPASMTDRANEIFKIINKDYSNYNRLDNLTLNSQIGKGNTGHIFLITDYINNKKYATKINIRPKDLNHIEQKIMLYQYLESLNVGVKYISTYIYNNSKEFNKNNEPISVYMYAILMKKYRTDALKYIMLKYADLNDLILNIYYLIHKIIKNKIIYLDYKLENILLSLNKDNNNIEECVFGDIETAYICHFSEIQDLAPLCSKKYNFRESDFNILIQIYLFLIYFITFITINEKKSLKNNIIIQKLKNYTIDDIELFFQTISILYNEDLPGYFLFFNILRMISYNLFNIIINKKIEITISLINEIKKTIINDILKLNYNPDFNYDISDPIEQELSNFLQSNTESKSTSPQALYSKPQEQIPKKADSNIISKIKSIANSRSESNINPYSTATQRPRSAIKQRSNSVVDVRQRSNPVANVRQRSNSVAKQRPNQALIQRSSSIINHSNNR
jgi:hypothetical protein